MRRIAPTVMVILALAWVAPATESGASEPSPGTVASMGTGGEGSEAAMPVRSAERGEASASSATGHWLPGKLFGLIILLGLAILPIALRKE